MREFVAALDQGTTSTRFIIFDRSARVVACAQVEHRQIYPQPGWVEHDAEEIWARVKQVMDEGLRQSGLQATDLAAVGITNQRETTVVWDKASGIPVANAIVWQDTRVSDDVARLQREIGDAFFRSRTGLPLSTYFSALKLRWLLDHIPGLRRRAEAGEVLFGNIDSYLCRRLTRQHVTDVTNASRTQLMNLDTLAWDSELLRIFNIPEAMLPRICSSSEIYGEISEGPLAGVPVAGILGDQQAALFGQGCLHPGEAKNTYGTGCFLLMNTGRKPVPSRHGLLTTVAYKLGTEPARYALEGSIAIAGALVQWLRDNLGIIAGSGEIENLANSVPDNGGVYIVPAFSGLFAPYWNDKARGSIHGLTRYATKAHIARAALEASAFQTRDVVEAMEKDSGIRLELLRVDGGMAVNDLLMQFQADVLDRTVVRPQTIEATALGAACAAGLATGWIKDQCEFAAALGEGRRWAPSMDASRREEAYRKWKKAVARSIDWLD
ncbi:MAG TPA: glycerol kinase GlpK [Terriglobales bacterium]|nr:glycerol kinase GlpK [Terriglobales bacterium]